MNRLFLLVSLTLQHVRLMLFRSLCVLLFITPNASAEDRLAEYYLRAVPTAEQFVRRFDKTAPVDDFAVYTLFDNIAILVSANVDLPAEQRPSLEPVTRLLQVAEEMQDRNPSSRTFGNFRWYWRTANVTDPNAVEFAVARMLSIYLDTPDPLSDEARNMLTQLLEYSVNACLKRRINPDYTNIALYNAMHLILLGQIVDRPDVTQEGKRRLRNIVAHIWNHGIFEYNSPAYYFIDVDALQLGFRHVSDAQTKQTIHTLLELFWTDLSLHWYKPGFRLAGAQSRTYNYLYGTNDHMFRFFAFAGMAPYDQDAKYHAVLNSLRALYQPPPEIVKLNDLYPRGIARNWGRDQGQWAVTYMLDDIVLGTAGAKYNARQNMVQTVDMPDWETAEDLADIPVCLETWQFKPRSYFIADGREDPYGTKLYPTGRAEQQKPLHLDALWFGSQRTVDSLGIALYPPEAIADPVVVNVQSHFVVRKPESIWINDQQVALSPNQPVNVGNLPVVFRYRNCAFGIRAVWTRHQNGQPAEVFLVDDGNEQGVYRLTVEHGVPPLESADDCIAGTAFWVRIGSRLESESQFSTWRQQYISSAVNRLDVRHNDIDIEVAGQDGIVAVKWADSVVTTEPAAPTGILTLNGQDLGRSILKKIPEVVRFVKQRNDAIPIVVNSSGTYWEVEGGYSFFDDWIEPDELASGGVAARINQDVSWQLQVEQSGEYFLWGRVQTRDTEHDSFRVETAKRLPDGSFMRRSMNVDWNLGVRAHWTWVCLPVPIRLEKGVWQLTLKPREYEGRIDRLFLSVDPAVKPTCWDFFENCHPMHQKNLSTDCLATPIDPFGTPPRERVENFENDPSIFTQQF